MDKVIKEMTDRQLLVYEAELAAQFQVLQKKLQEIRREFNERIRQELTKDHGSPIN